MSTGDAEDVVSLWLSWKRAAEVSRGRILAEVIAHSALTEPELTALTHLDEAGGALRQNALAAATGWDRTRLSHLLSRMEERGYVSRTRLRNGVDVTMRDAGREALASTKEPLTRAVWHSFANRLTVQQQASLREIIAALNE